MGQYLSNAALVVEGRVLEETFAVRNPETGSIETVHTIFIDRILKGSAAYNSVEVHTPGGRLDDVIESVSHGSTLSGGQKGIYLLSPNSSSGYHLHEGNAGKITRLKSDDDYEAIHWGELDKYKSWRQLREQVGESLGVDLTIHPLTEAELRSLSNPKEFCIKLDNPVPNVHEMTVEFDVMAKSSVPGLEFGRAEVLIDYPAGNLGEFIVDQEKIEAKKGDISDGPAYTVDVKDQTKDQIGLTIESPCDNSEPHYVLDTVYEKLATLTIAVNEWGDFGTMNVGEFAVAGIAEYVNPPTFQGTPGCTEFEDLCGEGEYDLLMCGLDGVDGIYRSGIHETITLTGSRLTDPDRVAAILIPNGDQPNGDKLIVRQDDSNLVTSWTEDQITFRLSSNTPLASVQTSTGPVATGNWELTFLGGLRRCRTHVDVEYALTNHDVTIPINGVDETFRDRVKSFTFIEGDSEHQDGQFHYYINNDPVKLAAAGVSEIDFIDVVQQAFCDWERESGLNFAFAGTTLQSRGSTDRSIIEFATPTNAEGGHVAETLRSSQTGRVPCLSLSEFPDRVTQVIDGNIVGADILIDPNQSWHADVFTGPNGNQVSLYTVLLHEIGHLIGHSHAIGVGGGSNSNDVIMWWDTNEGRLQTTFDDGSKNGGVWLRTNSVEEASPDGCLDNREISPNTSAVCTIDFTSDVKDFALPKHHSEKGILLRQGQLLELEVGFDWVVTSANGVLIGREKGGASLNVNWPSGVYYAIGKGNSKNSILKVVVQ